MWQAEPSPRAATLSWEDAVLHHRDTAQVCWLPNKTSEAHLGNSQLPGASAPQRAPTVLPDPGSQVTLAGTETDHVLVPGSISTDEWAEGGLCSQHPQTVPR